MKKYFLIISMFTFSAANVFADETYVFKNESKIYDVKVSVENCDKEEKQTICNSKGVFYLLKKNTSEVTQTIEMAETWLTISGNLRKKGDLSELYGKEHGGVYFADYNFDGIADLGIGNGNYRPYGGVSYDVFLYSKAQRKFVRHEELSRLETEMVSTDVNTKLRIIETDTKSGCCWNEKSRYRFVGDRLQKFYVFTEDATDPNGKWVEVTTERLVKNKWRTSSKRFLRKKYYKD